PAEKVAIWNRVATGVPFGARRGPRRRSATAYPTAIAAINSQTSGCGAHTGNATSAASKGTSSVLRDQVDRREDEDPHDVDEVPVQTGDLDALRIRLGQPALRGAAPQDQQPDDAHRHVRAVQPGEREERRPEHVGRKGEALSVELGELEDLT